MPELLTKRIATEYRDKANEMTLGVSQDISDRRKLRIELQSRCSLTELEAVNIINGCHIQDYVTIAAIRNRRKNR